MEPGGFDRFAGPRDYRGYFRFDCRQGIGIFRANPSCRAPGDCVAARPFYRYDDLDDPPPRGDPLPANLVSVSPRGRRVHIEYAFNESLSGAGRGVDPRVGVLRVVWRPSSVVEPDPLGDRPELTARRTRYRSAWGASCPFHRGLSIASLPVCLIGDHPEKEEP